MKRKWILLTWEKWRIKWNIDFPTFDWTYLWQNCRDIWRTNLINSLLCPFECLYLWRNYRTNLRTSIINTLLWSKLFWNKYIWKIHFELKNVPNVLGILLKTILKFRNSHFYKNSYSKNCSFFSPDTLFGYFGRKINIDNTSENIKCGNL